MILNHIVKRGTVEQVERIDIILQPTVSEFETMLCELIENCSASQFTLLYCGHGG